jgi:tRNA 2-thiouridine synthesizing protein B
MSDVFLLTKPPRSDKAKLCFKLMKRSRGARLYLCGDGVYNILNGIDILPRNGIFACREDMQARGISDRKNITALDDFYERMVNDLMASDRFYNF